MRTIAVAALLAVFAGSQGSAMADVIDFRLTGNGGFGLLESNVTPPTGSTGSGGIGASGITFDTVSRVLHVHVEWGSGFGFGDLTGNVTMLHWHGPTMDLPPDGHSQTGPLIINLALAPTFVSAGTGGGVNGNYLVNPDDVAGLLEGRTYINVHTQLFEFGEIRGYLAAVPEPGSLVLVAVCPGACLLPRRRRVNV